MAKEGLDKEDLPFEIPEFDENEFVRKELISFRTTVTIFVFALLVALTTFFIWRATHFPFLALFLLAVATGAALPFIYRALRIDIGHFGRKEWLGTITLHVFFWLGFTLLLSTPPISDNAAPKIDAYAAPSVQGVGEPLTLAVYAADNQALDMSKLQMCLRFNGTTGASSNCENVTWTQVPGKDIWTANWTAQKQGTYKLQVNAADKTGLSEVRTIDIMIGNPFPVIDPTSVTSFNSLSQSLVVRPMTGFRDLRAVEYTIDNTTYTMVPPTKDRPQYWTTNPTYPGWKVGANNVTIQAVEQPVYIHGYKLEGGVSKAVNASRTYTVDANFPDRAPAN